jgi:hypothetical protein
VRRLDRKDGFLMGRPQPGRSWSAPAAPSKHAGHDPTFHADPPTHVGARVTHFVETALEPCAGGNQRDQCSVERQRDLAAVDVAGKDQVYTA